MKEIELKSKMCRRAQPGGRHGHPEAGAWNLTAKFISPDEPELQQYALTIYAGWLVKAVIKQIDMIADETDITIESLQPALTSDTLNCTIRTPIHCKTKGSNK